MRVIIAGAGEVGRGVANALRQEKRSVALIDPKPSAINESQSLDCLLVTGSVLSRDSLLRAGISDAEIIVMATNNDEVNLLACAFAKRVYSEQVGDRNAAGLTVVAVISNPNLLNTDRGAGPLEKWTRADHIVCSSDQIVEQLAAGLLAPSIDEILSFGDKSWISAVNVTSKSALIGVSTGDVTNVFVDIPLIYAISSENDGGRLTDGSEIIKEGDILVFVSRSTSKFNLITKAVGRIDPELPEKPLVAIFGATQFGNKLAKHYLEIGSEVVVIEPNLDHANELVGSKIGMNKRLDVIHGDPQDEDLLRELGIDNQDITIAALNDDNLNIAISMRAKDKGVARTGLLLKDRALVEAVQRIGLTRPISRRLVTVTSILKSIHMNIPGTYQSIPTLPEIISMSATLNSGNNLVGKTVEEAEHKIGSRIALIEKEDEDGVLNVLNPSQVDVLEVSDKIYLFLEKTDLKRVEKSLEN
ncbi:MAG: NAD-binding protein [Candidatus Thalassarchaeaceae archaeon]|nr:NAD-binding protein [Candidatus Thalassarchaeaceae archaeon]